MATNTTAKILNSKKNYVDNLAEKICKTQIESEGLLSIIKSFTKWKTIPI